jgi:cell division protein FtsW (lipid II flippase)
VCLAGLLVLPFLWTQMSREQRSRVTALFEQNAPSETPTAGGYHLHQSKQMFALGGLWGSFLTGAVIDDPAAYHLPEAHTDFIFAVIGERFGLWGTGLVLIFFCLLAWRGAALAAATREPFGRLVAAGLVSLFAVEVAVNTSMTVGLAPITGLSLPLVSYGGSGLLAHLVALGLIMNVAVRPGYEIAAEPFQFARSDRSRKRNGASRPVKRLQASGYRETGANRYLGPEA